MSNLNRLLRYIPILQVLQREKGAQVLEVGCGSRGMAAFWAEKVIGCDIDFTDFSGVTRPIERNLIPVKGTAAALPFRDRSFDYVVCVDVLEHIPSDQRPVAISECLRVSRDCLFLAFPNGACAVDSDERLYRYWLRKRSMIQPWLAEHRVYGLPKLSETEEILHRLPCVWIVKEGNWTTLHYWFERLEGARCIGPYIAAVGDFMAPKPWDFHGHKRITNIVCLIVRLMRPLLRMADLSPGYRMFAFVRRI